VVSAALRLEPRSDGTIGTTETVLGIQRFKPTPDPIRGIEPFDRTQGRLLERLERIEFLRRTDERASVLVSY
jgi:hypothetical protein